ncbi:DUF6862 domain-containing protein [Lysobacter arvi]|uniref:DUF6862 domain-containing protein n=1 Tax=Lysobacter arvi TaxID=3038776 RepID=A0ABU1CE52_9GAMM|nr:hypothetical protein [Lysobacter arvi]MDR0183479.1 hypothetical protein [Lysobacter arvi]
MCGPNATAEEKEAKRNLIATVVAGIAGGTGADGAAALNGAIAATDNNYLTQDQLRKLKADLDDCGSDDACLSRVRNEARELSRKQDEDLKAACAENAGASACVGYRAGLMEYTTDRMHDLVDVLGVGDDWSRSYWANQGYLPPAGSGGAMDAVPIMPQEWTVQALAWWGGAIEKSSDEYGFASKETAAVFATGLAQAALSRVPGIRGITNTNGSWGGAASGKAAPADPSKIDATQYKGEMLGAGGARTASATVWKGAGKERIDVENPAPGVRAGQIHYQDNAGNKYYYDPNSKVFFDKKTGLLAPPKVQSLLDDPKILKSIDKALHGYLGASK